LEVRALLEQMAARYTPEQRAATGFTDNAIDQQVALLTSPWFIKLLAFDPVPTLAKVKCLVLALNGEKDLQVSFRENLDGIKNGLAAAGNHDITTRALPDLSPLPTLPDRRRLRVWQDRRNHESGGFEPRERLDRAAPASEHGREGMMSGCAAHSTRRLLKSTLAERG
jgi:hypothetical protein